MQKLCQKIPSLSVIQFFDELASREAVIFLTGQIFSKPKSEQEFNKNLNNKFSWRKLTSNLFSVYCYKTLYKMVFVPALKL